MLDESSLRKNLTKKKPRRVIWRKRGRLVVVCVCVADHPIPDTLTPALQGSHAVSRGQSETRSLPRSLGVKGLGWGV